MPTKSKFLEGTSDTKEMCQKRISAIGIHTHSKPLVSKAGENKIIKKAFLINDKKPEKK